MKMTVNTKDLVAVDLGDQTIRACQLSKDEAGKYKLAWYLQKDPCLDPLLNDQYKRVPREAALKELLREAPVANKAIVCAIAGLSVFSRIRILPPVEAEKVSQLVRYEIQQQIPFALDQINLSYDVLGRTDGDGYEVLMAAVRNDVAARQSALFQNSGYYVHFLGVDVFAFYNWLKHSGQSDNANESVIALIDIGARATNICIENKGKFYFTRPLTLGGNDFTASIRDALGVSFEDAEKIKLSHDTEDDDFSNKDRELIKKAVSGISERLFTEIDRSFSYARALPGGGAVEQVVLTGGSAILSRLAPFLQEKLGVPVKIADPLANLAYDPDLIVSPNQMSTVLGLALSCHEPEAISINLLR